MYRWKERRRGKKSSSQEVELVLISAGPQLQEGGGEGL